MNSQETISKIVKARDIGEFTDLVFVCEEQKIPVHKVIICSQSPVFHAACTGAFKEAFGVYNIDDFSLSMVRRMVDYLYTGDYTVNVAEPDIEGQTHDRSLLRIHAMVFALADKYLVAGLQVLSANKYMNVCEEEHDTFGFLYSLPDVYNLTPSSVRKLRDVALDFARKNLPESLASPGTKKLYDTMATEIPDFAKELLDLLLQEPLGESCPTCGYGRLGPVKQTKHKKLGRFY